ncbi:hypothetical protein O181_015463 [Austropuccinia psidii MF-1]|uniref:Uncharacterized protein n=1 Tax=Austropuccinia psidii MF-1 TaxID=1389203 RepID=A0A9Q3GQ03_9BASI|nr:hypothetical protein [Austropuccinia psidii MF-1]
MSNCRPIETPMIPHLYLEEASDCERKEFLKLNTNYCSTIGNLRYLSNATRPDLAYTVSALLQFLEKPGISHWKSFLHVLQYFKGNPNIQLTYKKNLTEPLEAYSDADWGNSEAEYRELTDLTKEILWIGQFGEEIGILENLKTTVVHEDNQGCINTANSNCNTNGRRMKHIEIQLHFIREVMQRSIIELQYAATANMLADFLTKAINRATIQRE